MKGLFDGLLKWIIVALALGAGFVFVLKTLLNPPRASAPISQTPQSSQPLSPPIQNNKPEKLPQVNDENTTSNPNNLESQSGSNSPKEEPELVRNNQPQGNDIPVNEQPEEYVLEIPEKLEEGADLKVYLNNDSNLNPNPANYSPSKVEKTPNIALVSSERQDIFQESTGYFKVEKSGAYNFLVAHPDKFYFEDGRLVTKIDSEPLSNSRGGRVELSEGWHRIDLFYNPQNYGRRIDAEEITVKMALPGEVAEPIDIWREAKDSNTAQKPETKQAK